MLGHAGAIAEIKSILKPRGLAYISVTKALRKRKNDARAVLAEEWKLSRTRILENASKLPVPSLFSFTDESFTRT